MTTMPTHATTIRPLVHFTAPQGWLNDPHGICWVDGRYHLFYQYNPDGREWASAVYWGHATSPDLVHWRHLPIALTPRPGEGCWTGAAVIEDGRPTIFYTSVDAATPSIGRIAMAFPDPDLGTWTSSPRDVVIDGPPAVLDAVVFRDPCIFATDTGWTMIVGVGVEGGTGLVVQYTSPDRRSWSYTGVVCSRPMEAVDGVWTGSMWECPQLFRVGADWVLAVSVWDDDTLFYVAAAVGSYDGATFTPERWSRLTHDDIAYAMTSFTDRDGRPGVMFWLREEADHRPESRSWAGALSLPMTVEVTVDRTIRLRPHPDVDDARPVQQLHDLPSTGRQVVDASGALSVELPAGGSSEWKLMLDGAEGLLLTLSTDGNSLQAVRPDRPILMIPAGGGAMTVIIDAGVVEIYTDTGFAAVRIAIEPAPVLTVQGSGTRHVVVRRLATR